MIQQLHTTTTSSSNLKEALFALCPHFGREELDREYVPLFFYTQVGSPLERLYVVCTVKHYDIESLT